MPACRDCAMLEGDRCKAHEMALKEWQRPGEEPPPPLGGCPVAIVRDYLKCIQPGMRVLEIGTGVWSPILIRTKEVGADYEGIDARPEYFGKKTVATRIENLKDLSFENESFDLVIGNQTMEHWGEFGCDLRLGLWQTFRVCKKGGQVFMNVPIHFHGTKEFILGDLDRLRFYFSKFSREPKLEKWGYPSSPLPPYEPHPGYRKLSHKHPYVLDIRAKKDGDVGPKPKNRVFLHARIQRLMNYPPSFNWYRWKKKWAKAVGAFV